jgi:RNA polymerase sigma-70 factor (ECF subfamily)
MLAWLYRVASNMAADQLRRSARETAVADLPERGALDATETLPEREAVARALCTLPDDYQLVVHLRLVEDYAFDDVARVMGRTVGACQMLMLRAGRELREALEREGIRAGA